MRITILAAALCMMSGTSQAACVCACVQGRATNVCSDEPGSLNLPIICQRLCMNPVTEPLNLLGRPKFDEPPLGPTQKPGGPVSDPAVTSPR